MSKRGCDWTGQLRHFQVMWKEDYAVLICYRIGLWRHHFLRWMHRVNNSIKLLSSGKIQAWFIRIAIWIPRWTLRYLRCNFYGWMWSSANSFLSALWWRGVSICSGIYNRLTGEFWINSTAWDFYLLFRLLRKLKRKLNVLFVGKKAFHYEIALRLIQPSLFSSRRNAWPVFCCFEMQPRQRRFGEFWGTDLLYGQGNYVFKRKFMYL